MSVDGGALIFTTDAPYDYQVMLESANRYAKRQGAIRLDFEGEQWTVNASKRGTARCSRCGNQVDALSYAHRGKVLCVRCARSTGLNPSRSSTSTRKPRRRTPRRPLGVDSPQWQPTGDEV